MAEAMADYFIDGTHPTQLLMELNYLRESALFCDVTICVDDEEFPCHRVLLASSSSYFKTMFSIDLMESKQDRVVIKGIEASVMQLIVDYIYTSKILITETNIQSLLSAAHLFEMVPIKDACCRFMEQNLDQSNCVGVHCFTEMLSCTNMQNNAKDFTLKYFSTVSVRDEILTVSDTKLIELIVDNKLNVTSEEQVLRCILRWYHFSEETRRDQFPYVFQHVRLPLIDPDLLQITAQREDIINKSEICMELIKKTRKKYPPNIRRFELLHSCGQPRNPSANMLCEKPLWQFGHSITDLDFMPNGDVVVADGAGLGVFDKRSRNVDHPLSKLCEGILEGVCVDRARNVVASIALRCDKPGHLYICTKVKGKWKQFTHSICEQPRCLASATDGGVIVGTYCAKLLKYDTECEEVWHKQLSGNIHDITVDNKNKVLVCHDEYITVYNRKGEEKFSFPTDTAHGKLEPRGICVNSTNNILVADGVCKSILLYTCRGKYMGQLLKVDGTPWSMALYNDKYLGVSINDDALCMYKI